jgi:hypothetical protein
MGAAACGNDTLSPLPDAPAGYMGPVTVEVDNHATGGVVVSFPAGISCPKTCSAQFAIGSTVALSLDMHQQYFTALFSQPCSKVSGDDFSCSFTVTKPTIVTVEGGQEAAPAPAPADR